MEKIYSCKVVANHWFKPFRNFFLSSLMLLLFFYEVNGQKILDNFTTQPRLAYSTRLLKTSYTGPAMRVRRDIDNVLVDVYFDTDGVVSLNSPVSADGGGAATGNTLGTWVGSNSAFVTIWYDQSGNSTNAVQATAVSAVKTGTITTSTSSPTVTGTGTTFATTLGTTGQAAVGSALMTSAGVYIGTVASVESSTSLTLKSNAKVALTGSTYYFSMQPRIVESGLVDKLPNGMPTLTLLSAANGTNTSGAAGNGFSIGLSLQNMIYLNTFSVHRCEIINNGAAYLFGTGKASGTGQDGKYFINYRSTTALSQLGTGTTTTYRQDLGITLNTLYAVRVSASQDASQMTTSSGLNSGTYNALFGTTYTAIDNSATCYLFRQPSTSSRSMQGVSPEFIFFGSTSTAMSEIDATNLLNDQAYTFVSPLVTAAVQSATCEDGQSVQAQGNGPAGNVYIIKDDVAPQTTVTDFNAAIAAHKGASAAITAASTPVNISTTNLAPGTYYAYYAYPNGSVSAKGTNAITILPSSIATLSGLYYNIGTGAVSVPDFSSGTTTYNVVLPFGTSSVPAITYTTTEPHALALVTGPGAVTGTATVVVTAQDGVTSLTYTINFTMASAPSDDATLSALSVSSGTLVPTFDPAVLSYTVQLPYGTTTVPTITPVKNHIKANVEVADAAAVPGTTSVKVTAEDGVTIKTYTINFTVAPPSTDATLSALTVSAGTLTPVFNASTLTYTVILPSGSTVVPTVNATKNDTRASDPVITLATALPGTTTVMVTAQDGVTIKTYTVNFQVAASSVATLSALTVSAGTLSPAFAANTTSYTVQLPYGTTVVPTLTPTKTDTKATIQQVNALVLGGSTTITVTAEDGVTTKTYNISFTVAQNSAKDILSFSFDGLSSALPGTVIDAVNHTVTLKVATGTDLSRLTPTISISPDATISPASGLARSFINSATYTVTAQNGTTQAWTVTVMVVTGVYNNQGNSIIIYPVPVRSNILFINVPESFVNGKIGVYSLIGNLVEEQIIDKVKVEVDLSGLPSGNYLVKIRPKGGAPVVKPITKL